MTNRYMTPLKYKDGNGKEKTTKLFFEIDPIELTDWTMENPFQANELRASLIDMEAWEKDESRDLTPEEIRVMLGVIKLLAQLSAGRPTDDGEYFLKDPNWTSSYAYRGFRMFLMTNPNEVTQFLKSLLDNGVMEEFTAAIEKANAETAAEQAKNPDQARATDSGEETLAKMQARIRELEAGNAAQSASE